MSTPARDRALALVRAWHEGQFNSKGQMPYWHHLARVSRYLDLTLGESGEGTPEEREAIILAGYGHDLLEDTKAPREDALAIFGERGLALIDGMTQRDDDPVAAYVDQVRTAEEGVRLIKLADLYDNCTSVGYTVFLMGPEWIRGYFLPKVAPMAEAVLETAFTTYPQTAERLKGMVRMALATLEEEIERFEEKGERPAG